jgi:hypothetical protein
MLRSFDDVERNKAKNIPALLGNHGTQEAFQHAVTIKTEQEMTADQRYLLTCVCHQEFTCLAYFPALTFDLHPNLDALHMIYLE